MTERIPQQTVGVMQLRRVDVIADALPRKGPRKGE